jgi:hypothetical protein
MRLIAFTGYKQSGKDTAASVLIEHLHPQPCYQVNFADALKEEVAHACGVSIGYINAHKTAFRTMLQWWGTDFRRQLHDEQYWIAKWVARAARVPANARYLFATDVRFINEAAIVHDAGGTIVRIVRPGLVSDGHASETEQDKILADHAIINEGTRQDLLQKLKQELKLN